MPKYPNITIKLTGKDGNVFNLMGIMCHKMKRGGVSDQEIETFLEEAMSGDYNNFLRTCMKWAVIE